MIRTSRGQTATSVTRTRTICCLRSRGCRRSPTTAAGSARSVAASCARRWSRNADGRRSNARPRRKPASMQRASRAAEAAVRSRCAWKPEKQPRRRCRPSSHRPKTRVRARISLIPSGRFADRPSGTAWGSPAGPRTVRTRCASTASRTNAPDGTGPGDRAERRRATTRSAWPAGRPTELAPRSARRSAHR